MKYTVAQQPIFDTQICPFCFNSAKLFLWACWIVAGICWCH